VPEKKKQQTLQDDGAKAIRDMLPRMAFNTVLGIRLHETHDDGVTIKCRVKPKLLNLVGVLHGGVSATLADAAVGIATTRHYKGRPITTVELKINYFRPIALGSTVYARARLRRTGSTLSIGEVEIHDSEKNLCGLAIVTYILLDMRGATPAK
jgi:acyl-CoA thioesterase